jgi:hypothetical protein
VLEGGARRNRDLLAFDEGPGPEHLRIANSRSHPTVAYVEVSIGQSQTATYSLAVSTAGPS